VIDADFIPATARPSSSFEYVERPRRWRDDRGSLFAPEDALELARQVTSGLVHLHAEGVFHCDIKPRNLLWTGVAPRSSTSTSRSSREWGRGGGSRKDLPPDLDSKPVCPSPEEIADRDIYALGLNPLEAVVGRYPWDNAQVPAARQAREHPRELSSLSDIAAELVDVMLKGYRPETR